MKQRFETPHLSKFRPSVEMQDLIRRRTIPYMDSTGLDRPLSFVLQEVYIQGMRDATQALEDRCKPSIDQPLDYCC